MKTLPKYLAIAAAIVGLTQVAQAIPQLRLSDGINPDVLVSDNGVGDTSGGAGQVVWVGSIGNWFLNVHVGSTYPVIGTLTNPALDVTFHANSTAAGTLTISFAADGFGPTNGSAAGSIGGTIASGGSLTYNTYGGTNNTNFSTSNLLTSQGPFGPGAFSGSVTGGNVSNVGPYALTQIVTITHATAGLTTGDALLTVPESGTSILLLGAGLTGLGLLARIRRRMA